MVVGGGSLMRKLFFVAVVVVALAAAAAALADQPSPQDPVPRSGHVLGIVPVHNRAGQSAGAGGNLAYHNGPVMHTNATYAIYWLPAGYAVSANYQSLLNQFFGDVAADS